MRPSGPGLAPGAHRGNDDMPNRPTHEQMAAHDDKGERHVVMVMRSSIPGSPHLKDRRTTHGATDKRCTSLTRKPASSSAWSPDSD